MQRAGDLLKQKRIESGIEISAVFENTKIPQKLILAIENCDYDAFASEVYLKGFLKNYSRFLGIDEQKVLAIYRRESKKKLSSPLKESRSGIEEVKPIITPQRLVFAITILFMFSILTFVAIQIKKVLKPPYLSLRDPINVIAPAEQFIEVNSEYIDISGKVDVGSNLSINGNEVNTNALQEFRVEKYKLEKGKNEIVIAAQSFYFSKTNQIKLVVNYVPQTIDENQQSSATSTGGLYGDVKEMLVEIEVLQDNAWIELTIDKEKKINQVAEKNTRFSFTAKSNVEIYTPRPSFIRFYINNLEYPLSNQKMVFRFENGEIKQGN